MSTQRSSSRKVRIEGEDKDRIIRSVTTPNIKLDTMLADLGEFFELDRFTHSSPRGRKLREIKQKEELILEHFKQERYIKRFEPATVVRRGKDTGELIENSIRIIRRELLEEETYL